MVDLCIEFGSELTFRMFICVGSAFGASLVSRQYIFSKKVSTIVVLYCEFGCELTQQISQKSAQ
jgi:hypothetical protein